MNGLLNWIRRLLGLEPIYCRVCGSRPSSWNHPTDNCPRECWDCYYGLRNHD